MVLVIENTDGTKTVLPLDSVEAITESYDGSTILTKSGHTFHATNSWEELSTMLTLLLQMAFGPMISFRQHEDDSDEDPPEFYKPSDN